MKLGIFNPALVVMNQTMVYIVCATCNWSKEMVHELNHYLFHMERWSIENKIRMTSVPEALLLRYIVEIKSKQTDSSVYKALSVYNVSSMMLLMVFLQIFQYSKKLKYFNDELRIISIISS